MKCIQEIRTQAIKRVSNEAAAILVGKGDYRYIPKAKWRAAKRNQAQQETR